MKLIENVKAKLKGKKFDPITVALVGLLTVSSVFSAVMISTDGGINQNEITPVVSGDNESENGIVDGSEDGSDEETITTLSEVASTEKVILPLADDNPEISVSYLATNATDLSMPMFKMVKQGDTYYTKESRGVTYQTSDNNVTNVVSALSGTVESIEEDLISGTIVTVLHEGNVRTIYTGVHEVTVSVDARLTQGDVIGKTGASMYTEESANVIHFEIIKDGQSINPEVALNKSINEIE